MRIKYKNYVITQDSTNHIIVYQNKDIVAKLYCEEHLDKEHLLSSVKIIIDNIN